jgi:hypothetical protein
MPLAAARGPTQFLDGFRGYLQADAYAGYDALYASGAVVEVVEISQPEVLAIATSIALFGIDFAVGEHGWGRAARSQRFDCRTLPPIDK